MSFAASRPARADSNKPVRPVARLSTPAEMVAVVPSLLGFVPSDSLVAVSLRGPRGRVGVTMRFDLGWCEDAVAAAAEIADRLAFDGAGLVLLVVYSELPDGPSAGAPRPGEPGSRRPAPGRPGEAVLARSELVAAVGRACTSQGIEVSEALLVRGGRWYSYSCRGRECCPAGGTPVEVPATAALRLVETARVLDGDVVLGSRQELVRTVAPPVLLAAVAAEQAWQREHDAWTAVGLQSGEAAQRLHGLDVARSALVSSGDPSGVSLSQATALSVALQDLLVRDQVATWALDCSDALLALLLQSVRLVAPPHDAGLCTVLAWIAYSRGNGGLANVALERAQASDPGYPLALLLQDCLSAQVSAKQVRKLLKSTRRDLRAVFGPV